MSVTAAEILSTTIANALEDSHGRLAVHDFYLTIKAFGEQLAEKHRQHEIGFCPNCSQATKDRVGTQFLCRFCQGQYPEVFQEKEAFRG